MALQGRPGDVFSETQALVERLDHILTEIQEQLEQRPWERLLEQERGDRGADRETDQ